jgi:Domain of unknown function (DUF6471)
VRERDFYEQRAKDYIKEERVRRSVSYKELARRLEGMGVPIDARVLINRINRGNFSFAFALQVLAALGVTQLHIGRLASPSRKARGTPHTG